MSIAASPVDYLSQLIVDEIIVEYGARNELDARLQRAADSIRGSLFEQQLDALLDPARRVSVLCPRRAGKSWTAMSSAFDTCLRKPRAQVVICTLTMRHAKTIYWSEMQHFALQYGVIVAPHAQDMRLTFENGSTISLIGAESSAEIEKLRGGKYDLVIVDECKSYSARIMRELIDDVVWPALGDRLGKLMLIGTPGNILKGYFYEATAPGFKRRTRSREWMVSRDFRSPEAYWSTADHDPLWSRHHWTRQDNVTLPHLWEESLKTKLDNGWDDNHPTWRREHLGEWVPSESSFVYAYATLSVTQPGTVTWEPDGARLHGLPEGDWQYVMGLDLGYQDDYAVVVVAYSPTAKSMYHVYDFKENHKDIYEIAAKIEEVYRRFEGKFTAMVADTAGLGELVVETLNKRFGFQFQKADKKQKFDHIELLNGDFRSGRAKVIPGSSLDYELQMLQWAVGEGEDIGDLAARGKLKEVASIPNHLCDALLYAWRFCYHFWSESAKEASRPGTQAWEEEQKLAAMQFMVNKRSRSDSLNWINQLAADDVDLLGDW